MTTTPNPSIKVVSLNKIKPSPTQPRKHFNIAQMVDNMRQNGYIKLFPLLVRIWPGSQGTNGDTEYELVDGERRWRSAQKVGLTEAPVLIGELTDQEVIETQLIEFVQHEDLTPIEEAEHYKKLLALVDGTGAPMHTTATLAKKIGVDEDTVRLKVSLAALEGEARAAVDSGVLAPRTASLIARILDPKARNKFAQTVLHPTVRQHNPGATGPLTYREAEEEAEKYTKDLRGAIFDTKNADLVPVQLNEKTKERMLGGACTDCPFRSGNTQTGLHPSKQNICTKPACYDLKVKAEWKQWQASETDPAKNRKALSAEECTAIYQFGDQLYHSSGLVDLDQRPDSSDLKPGQDAPGTWRKLTKDKDLSVTVARDKNLRSHELANRSEATTAAKANGHKIFRDSEREEQRPQTRADLGLMPPVDMSTTDAAKWLTGKPNESEVELQKKTSAMKKAVNSEHESQITQALLAEVFRLSQQRANFLTPDFFRLAIPFMMDTIDGGGLTWIVNGFETGPDAVTKKLAKLSQKELIGVFAQVFIEGALESDGAHTPDFDKYMAALHVDAKRIEKKVKTDLESAAKAIAKANKGLPQGMTWLVPPREQYVFNQHDVCSEPSTLDLHFPGRTNLQLYVAKSAKGWHSAYRLTFDNGGGGGSYPSDKSKPEKTMEGALRLAALAAQKKLHPKLRSRFADYYVAIGGKPEPKKTGKKTAKPAKAAPSRKKGKPAKKKAVKKVVASGNGEA